MVSRRVVAAGVAGVVCSGLAARRWLARRQASRGFSSAGAPEEGPNASETPASEESWVEDIDFDDIAESFIGSLGAGVVLLGVLACIRMRRRRRHGRWLRMPRP